MQLSQQDLDEFKQIYKAEFGEDITDRQALDMGLNLVNLFTAMLKHQSQTRKID